ncbi:MAG: VCBS repeat-containing protein [bacterium]|nr:VCBS repeat-containing protein [bacterium]
MKTLAHWIAILGCLLSTAPASADSQHFDFFKLEFTGRMRTGVNVDLDADGRLDVAVLLSRKDDPTRLRFETCLQTAEGFSANCTTIQLPAETRVFDIGEIDGLPGAELVILTDRGIRVASFADGAFAEFAPLQKLQTLFAGTEEGKTARLRCLWDVDGDSRMELILPTIEGPRILRYSAEGLKLLQQIENHAEVTFRLANPMEEDLVGNPHGHALRTEARFASPQTFVQDYDGDSRVDVLVLQGKHLSVFLRRADGRYPAAPDFEWDRSILDTEEKDDPIASEGLAFADLNGDGVSDIIAIKWGSPSERMRIDRHIYYAREGLVYPDEPDQRLRSESIDRRLMIADLNGDGRPDLIAPFFHFAITQAAKVVIKNSIKIQFRLYLMGEDGRYSQDGDKSFARVDRRIALNYDIDILGFVFGNKTLPEDGFRPLISFNSDANGDGFPDLIADTGSNRLAFYWGNDRAGYSSSPDHVIDHESTLNYDLGDLNSDGKTDVVTYHGPRDRISARRFEKRRLKGARTAKPQKEEDVAARGPVVKILLSR